MNKRIRRKKLKAQILRERAHNMIYVEREDMEFLRDQLKRPPEYLPWVHQVPKKLFLNF